MEPASLLVDTDVFSYVAWRRSQADDFREILRGRLLSVSFATVGELFYGAAKGRWGPRRVERLTATLRPYIVLPGTYEVATTFGSILAAFRDQVEERDMWVAATAIVHEMPIVTNNLRHFRPMSERFGFGLEHPTLRDTQ